MKRDQERGIQQTEPVFTEFVRKDEEEKGIEIFFNYFKFIIFSFSTSNIQSKCCCRKEENSPVSCISFFDRYFFAFIQTINISCD